VALVATAAVAAPLAASTGQSVELSVLADD
jgi:hypothetical protein